MDSTHPASKYTCTARPPAFHTSILRPLTSVTHAPHTHQPSWHAPFHPHRRPSVTSITYPLIYPSANHPSIELPAHTSVLPSASIHPSVHPPTHPASPPPDRYSLSTLRIPVTDTRYRMNVSNSYTAQQDPSLQARRLWLSLTCEQPLGGRVAKGGPRLPDVAPPPALVRQTPTQEVPSTRYHTPSPSARPQPHCSHRGPSHAHRSLRNRSPSPVLVPCIYARHI